MKIKVVIVDDELHARSFMRKCCERYFAEKIEVVEECNSVDTAVRAIKKHQPDLVFLDVQMPEENGFELLKRFDRISFEIIFTTAYKDYAIEAIKNSALDYLMKPINIEDFQLAVARFEAKKSTKIDYDRFKLLTESINNQFSDKQRIVLPAKSGFDVVQTSSIIYCKSDGSYTSVYTVEKEYFTSKPLKEIEEMLSEPNFIRIHKSYLINRNFVRGFRSDDYTLTMITGEDVPVSDSMFPKKRLMDVISG